MSPRAYLNIGLAIALLLAVGYLFHLHSEAVDDLKDETFAAGQKDTQAKWDADKLRQSEARVTEANKNVEETKRRLDAQKRNDDVKEKQLADLRAANLRLDAAVDGLRLRAAEYLTTLGCPTSGDSALACIRKAAGALGDVLGQCGARHKQLAAEADDARIRGQQCERDYDALTMQP